MSAQKVLESAKLVYGLGYRSFIVSKASGSAAQSGVPDAQKLAIKHNRVFLFLYDIDDVLEILKPDEVLTVTSGKYGGTPLSQIINRLKGRVVIIFGGLEPGLSSRELEKGVVEEFFNRYFNLAQAKG